MFARRGVGAAVALGYVALSFLYFGVRLLPHPGRPLLGTGRDSEIFVWSFAWWPHAIRNGLNPLVSHAVFVPDGVNLAWTATVPGLAIAFAPVTLLVGPTASYNFAAVLLPAAAAWSAFALCRYVTRSLWPSVVGGYLFGFSSYMLGQQLGHMHMTAVFLVPLVALAVLRYVDGGSSGRGLAWRLGVLLGVQIWLSTELFFTLSLALAVGLVLAWATVPVTRRRLRTLPRPLLGAYGLAALIGSPLLAYALGDFETGSINPPRLFSADLLNPLVPTRLVALGGAAAAGLADRFPGNDAERGAYVGLPALAIVGWFALRRRRFRSGAFLLLAFALPAVAALGTALWIAGERIVPLPWDAIARLPVFNNVLPVRLMLFASLALAVIVALWSASSAAPRAARVLLPALAALSLVPAFWDAHWRTLPERPEFFAQPVLYESCLARGENVVIYPWGPRSSSMLWQAESGFWFDMAEGYLRPGTPKGFLAYNVHDPATADVLQLARDKHVSRVLSLERYGHPGPDQLKPIGALQLLGGVLVAPACGHPPIAR